MSYYLRVSAITWEHLLLLECLIVWEYLLWLDSICYHFRLSVITWGYMLLLQGICYCLIVSVITSDYLLSLEGICYNLSVYLIVLCLQKPWLWDTQHCWINYPRQVHIVTSVQIRTQQIFYKMPFYLFTLIWRWEEKEQLDSCRGAGRPLWKTKGTIGQL